MKAKQIKCIEHIQYKETNYTIMVYGELKDVKEICGFNIVPVKYNAKNDVIYDMEIEKMVNIPSFNTYFSKTKQFNMGWCICVEPDVFDEEKGKKICKRRFSRSPITTQNGRFLTPDMCQAIVDNEVKYIIKNIASYLPKNEENTNICKDNTPTDRLLPDNGDYVEVIGKDKRSYVGIFRNKTNDIFNFHFIAPVDAYGLICHDEAKMYHSMNENDIYDIPGKGNANTIRLINDYLRGGLNRIWDAKYNVFRLIIN